MDRMRDPNDDMDRDDRIDRELPETAPDTDEAATGPDWNRRQYVGEGQGDPGGPIVDQSDTAPRRTWESDEWVGEGQGDADRTDRDRHAEGNSGLGGHGHPAGESHWARSTEEDREPR